MSYESVYVRQYGDISKEFEYACLDAYGKIVPDINDGEIKHVGTATGIRIIAGKETVREKDKIKIEVYITNSRVVFQCDKYNTGDEGWFGDPISVGIATAIDRGVAAFSRVGKAMIGHIRYEWLEGVRYELRTGIFAKDELVLFFENQNKYHWFILKFKRDVDVKRLAEEVFVKACAYRLAMDDKKKEEETAFFQNPKEAKWQPLKKGTGGVVEMPNYYTAPTGGICYHPVYKDR